MSREYFIYVYKGDTKPVAVGACPVSPAYTDEAWEEFLNALPPLIRSGIVDTKTKREAIKEARLRWG